ncbi:MAG TPA: hypothetical protein P5140_01540 [Methanofastidiosum sp.]|nr:hypothetical protein [Methanofastidiosum sp.]HOT85022.1 hypothetical protein [Methanofastidiosum sp.]HPC80536.1 hypothetical protein [Methanofastidiosum sp.]HRS25215.1 hypothetical protein [Methanofastidiosum sp.]
MIGSASGNLGSDVRLFARELGRIIAENKLVLLSGACHGLPLEAVMGAKEAGGITVGVSPAINLKDHINDYNYPYHPDIFDSLIFTGSGYKGRNVTLVRSCDAVISVMGMIGTLNELTIAYDEKKIIGLSSGTGGVSDAFLDVLEKMGKSVDNIISSNEPSYLVDKIIESLNCL